MRDSIYLADISFCFKINLLLLHLLIFIAPYTLLILIDEFFTKHTPLMLAAYSNIFPIGNHL